VSELYPCTPNADGITSSSLNGKTVTPVIDKGYVVFKRSWKAGDRIDLVLPMKVQRVKASKEIAADRGRVALRYGPLIYNIERVDQDVTGILSPNAPLTTEWKPDLFKAVNGAPEGVVVIKGAFADGSPLLAIPNYARNNRGTQSSQARAAAAGGDPTIDYSGASSSAAGTNVVANPGSRGRRNRGSSSPSIVWIRDE
jgi:hypothetical protein